MYKKIAILTVWIIIAIFLQKSSCEQKYTVTKGDTLWDISSKFYNDAWKWKALYNFNSSTIKNPDLIYPGQELSLSDLTVATEQINANSQPVQEQVSETKKEDTTPQDTVETVQKEEQSQNEEPAAVADEEQPAETEETTTISQQEIQEETEAEKPVKKKIIKPQTLIDPNRTSVVPVNFQFDGRILGTKDDRTLISMQDSVYLDIGTYDGVKVGDEYIVYRKKGKITDPKNGRALGLKIFKLGIIRITDVSALNSSTAIVYKSYEPILKGDFVKLAE